MLGYGTSISRIIMNTDPDANLLLCSRGVRNGNVQGCMERREVSDTELIPLKP